MSDVRNNLIHVCDPRRFPNMSPLMAGILRVLLETDAWETAPTITGLEVSSDGYLVAHLGVHERLLVSTVAEAEANLRRLYMATQGTNAPMSQEGLNYLLDRLRAQQV